MMGSMTVDVGRIVWPDTSCRWGQPNKSRSELFVDEAGNFDYNFPNSGDLAISTMATNVSKHALDIGGYSKFSHEQVGTFLESLR